ncbi:YceI-like domain-containing protein [Lutibacter sp. Hel_I_33_5]|uniref:YceI family protein n=1 Tax=Lutibacter sp. Hel_I_33_5 TaxID=1566289 RepID=UPI0011A763CE|nr:YceI family protein [Lutibacter sp. Hel_I_33_5]TVZ57098.1 YceI-like domain-containing protein [Lutibacter sp. Hel_I_33_5]
MKKLIIYILLFSVTPYFVGCKSEAKKEVKTEEVEKKVKSTAAFSLQEASNKINWTAYKTTEKIGVKGQFKKVNITANGEGNTVREAINNAEFSIPLTSIFTSDTSRDYKIRKFFFGVMENTELLSGTLVLEDDVKGHALITMNGVSQKLPFVYSLVDKVFTFSTIMNINNWNAQKALTSLNEACKDLHKGTDGVSKTWNDVEIKITSTFK